MPQTNRRDRLHSYQFMVQRMVSAFVTYDTDPIRSPFRKGGTAVFVGTMLAVVIMAGWGVYGLLRPGGSTSWRVDDTLVMEKESGATFVYRNEVLYPTANFASARLLAEPGSRVRAVAAASLAGTPRGDVIGIPGAPQSLPRSAALLTGPWSLCSRPVVEDGAVTATRSVLLVGQVPPSGEALEGAAVVVRTGDDRTTALVWRGRRHVIDPAAVDALALGRQDAVVAESWLDALPRGADIAPVRVDDVGAPSSALDGARVGQVVRVRSMVRTEDFYLVRSDDLLPLSPLQAAVAVGAASTVPAYQGATPGYVDRGPGEVAAAPRGEPAPLAPETLAPPEALPDLQQGDSFLATCAVFDGDLGPPSFVTAVPDLPAGREATGVADEPAVDEVHVPPGRAVLVEAPTSAEFGAGAIALVTDTGRRYGIPDVETVQRLGYGSEDLVVMPSALVDRVPAGPVLDVARAAQPSGL